MRQFLIQIDHVIVILSVYMEWLIRELKFASSKNLRYKHS